MSLGLDLDIKDNFGNSLLHRAIAANSFKIVKLLVSKNININVTNVLNLTPLYNALDLKNRNIIKFLVKNGADINFKNFMSKTPLHKAIRLNNLDLSLLLIDLGADINAIDVFGDTPLTLAAYFCNCDIVDMFIINGANINLNSNISNKCLNSSIKEKINNIYLIDNYIKKNYYLDVLETIDEDTICLAIQRAINLKNLENFFSLIVNLDSKKIDNIKEIVKFILEYRLDKEDLLDIEKDKFIQLSKILKLNLDKINNLDNKFNRIKRFINSWYLNKALPIVVLDLIEDNGDIPLEILNLISNFI